MRKAFLILPLLLAIILAGYLIPENYGTNVNAQEEEFSLGDLSVELNPESIEVSEGKVSGTITITNNANVSSGDINYEIISEGGEVSASSANGDYSTHGTVSLGPHEKTTIPFGILGDFLKFVLKLFKGDDHVEHKFDLNNYVDFMITEMVPTTGSHKVKVNELVGVNITVKNKGPGSVTNGLVTADGASQKDITLGEDGEDQLILYVKAPSEKQVFFINAEAEASSQTDRRPQNNKAGIRMEATGGGFVTPIFAALLIAAGFIIAKRDTRKRK